MANYKVDMPREMVSEALEYNRLAFLKYGDISESGQVTFTSDSSGNTYNTADYPSNIDIYDKGELGMQNLFFMLYSGIGEWIVKAEDFHTPVSPQITVVQDTIDNYTLHVEQDPDFGAGYDTPNLKGKDGATNPTVIVTMNSDDRTGWIAAVNGTYSIPDGVTRGYPEDNFTIWSFDASNGDKNQIGICTLGVYYRNFNSTVVNNDLVWKRFEDGNTMVTNLISNNSNGWAAAIGGAYYIINGITNGYPEDIGIINHKVIGDLVYQTFISSTNKEYTRVFPISAPGTRILWTKYPDIFDTSTTVTWNFSAVQWQSKTAGEYWVTNGISLAYPEDNLQVMYFKSAGRLTLYMIGTVAIYISNFTTSTTGNLTISNRVDFMRKARKYQFTVPASAWLNSMAPFTQNISLSGIIATDAPVWDVVLVGSLTEKRTQRDEFGKIDEVIANNGYITLNCLDSKPTVDVIMQLVAPDIVVMS